VLSVEENKTRASAAATAPHRRQQESYKADKAAPSLQSANHYSVGIGISSNVLGGHPLLANEKEGRERNWRERRTGTKLAGEWREKKWRESMAGK